MNCPTKDEYIIKWTFPFHLYIPFPFLPFLLLSFSFPFLFPSFSLLLPFRFFPFLSFPFLFRSFSFLFSFLSPSVLSPFLSDIIYLWTILRKWFLHLESMNFHFQPMKHVKSMFHWLWKFIDSKQKPQCTMFSWVDKFLHNELAKRCLKQVWNRSKGFKWCLDGWWVDGWICSPSAAF